MAGPGFREQRRVSKTDPDKYEYAIDKKHPADIRAQKYTKKKPDVDRSEERIFNARFRNAPSDPNARTPRRGNAAADTAMMYDEFNLKQPCFQKLASLPPLISMPPTYSRTGPVLARRHGVFLRLPAYLGCGRFTTVVF